MTGTCQIHVVIVLGQLEMDEMEIAELFIRKIDSSLRAKHVVLEVWDYI